jgi:PhzF family phenazine biosynthesis protein
MPRTLRTFHVDAFTATPGGGNPATVALDAGALDPAEMQRIAAQRHDGDWVFALPASSPDVDLDVRFFSPRKELPFVGHATLALHAVLAQSAPRPLRRQHGTSGVVEVTSQPDRRFALRLAPPPLGRALAAAELAEVLALLGISAGQLDARCPPRIAGGTSSRLLLGLRAADVLDGLAPRLQELAALSPRLGAQGFFLFAAQNAEHRLTTTSRMFCPAIGIDEDPVSGNAHAMLGVHLHALGLLQPANGQARFIGHQGRHVGRPGQVEVTLELDADGQPAAASIAGTAVVGKEQLLTLG